MAEVGARGSLSVRGMALRWICGGVFLWLSTGSVVAQLRPPEMLELVAKAGFEGTVVRWCPAEIETGRARVFVVAVNPSQGERRYVVLDPDGSVTPLAPYAGTADVSCYPRERADEVGAAMKASDTVTGQLAPRWNSTVICAFVQETEAACWQFDPGGKRFVEVGRWRT